MSPQTMRRKVKFFIFVASLTILLTLWNFHRLQKETESVDMNQPRRDYVLVQTADDDYNRRDNEDKTKNKIAPSTRNEVKIFMESRVPNKVKTKSCVPLRTFRGPTPICIYRREEDNMISSYVRDYGTWEEDLLNATGNAFLSHPGMQFLDLGCNIGVYTLFVAKLQRKVVSVDPIRTNLELLSASLNLGKFSKNVTLLQNCISDTYETVSLNVPSGNIGGAHVIGTWNSSFQKHHNPDVGARAETVLLDDLIPFFKDKELFIKMDIEGYELRALQGARRFFQAVAVKFILMEWVHHRYTDNGEKIVQFLVRNGLLPFTDPLTGRFLDPDSYHTWPENVFWVKR